MSEIPELPSSKPYLIRAIYDWCVDAGFTPYLSVVVDENVKVPRAFVRDGLIVLNIAPHATKQFILDNEAMSCQARFGGAAQSLYVPIDAIQAIYARENGQGMAFEVNQTDLAAPAGAEIMAVPELEDETQIGFSSPEEGADPSASAPVEPVRPAIGRSHLRIIK